MRSLFRISHMAFELMVFGSLFLVSNLILSDRAMVLWVSVLSWLKELWSLKLSILVIND